VYLFNRSININVRSSDSTILTVNGTFLDSHHEICLTLVVDILTYTIVGAEGELLRTPHGNCRETRQLIENLIGLTIDKGIRRKLQSAVGYENGCTHLFELALECVKGLIQAKYSLMNLTLSPEQVTTYVEEYLRDSCYHYQSKHKEPSLQKAKEN